jgi:hypothetical protein
LLQWDAVYLNKKKWVMKNIDINNKEETVENKRVGKPKFLRENLRFPCNTLH